MCCCPCCCCPFLPFMAAAAPVAGLAAVPAPAGASATVSSCRAAGASLLTVRGHHGCVHTATEPLPYCMEAVDPSKKSRVLLTHYVSAFPSPCSHLSWHLPAPEVSTLLSPPDVNILADDKGADAGRVNDALTHSPAPAPWSLTRLSTAGTSTSTTPNMPKTNPTPWPCSSSHHHRLPLLP
jgi:hypothetical protein